MKRVFVYFGIAVAAWCLSQTTVQAGEINGNEASVISAASGTFEYEGKNYVAKQSYIDQLRAKMSADDVDLTAEQASKAIAEIYSNVATGVKEGYLEEVSSSSGKGTSSGSSSKIEGSVEGDPSASSAPGGAESTEDGISAGDGGQTGQSSEGQDTEGQDTGALKPPKGKFHISMEEVLKSVNVTEQSNPKQVRQVILEHYLQPVSRVFPILVSLSTLVLLIVLIYRRKGKWKKIWPAGLAILFLMAGISVGAMAAIFEFGFCSGKVLVNQVSSQEYYQKVYTDFHDRTASTLQSAGFPEDVLDEIFDERTIYLDGKLSLEAVFQSDRSKDFMNIQDEVKGRLMDYLSAENYSNMSEVSDSVGNLAGIIQNNYTDTLKFTYAEQMKTEKEVGQKLCLRLIIVGIILCILALLLLILSQRYVHRIWRVLGWSSFACALATGGTAVWYYLTKPYAQLGLEPQNYSDFFSGYLKWNAQLLIAVAGLEFLVFLVAVAAALSFKKIRKKNPFQKLK